MPFTIEHPRDDAPREEGEPFYALTRYTLAEASTTFFTFDVRAFPVLPPSDAVGLLNDEDSTGLVVWAGALALAEWLVLHPQMLREAALPAMHDSQAQRTVVLELGCGSGVLAVALCKLLSTLRAEALTAASVELVATDGNEACVQLCDRNLREQCAEVLMPVAQALRCRATKLRWDTEEDVQAAVSFAATDRLLVVSADVIYDASAGPLLVNTVARLVAQLEKAYDSRKGAVPAVRWWLLYTPRSLTRASNTAIYDGLVLALAAHPAWVVEQQPLPEGTYSSGFEGSVGSDGFALRGCLFSILIPGL